MAHPPRSLPPISPQSDALDRNADDAETPRKRKKKRRHIEQDSEDDRAPTDRSSARQSGRRQLPGSDVQDESGADADDQSVTPRRRSKVRTRAKRRETQGADSGTESRRRRKEQVA